MSKKRIEKWMPVAREALVECEIVKDGAFDGMFKDLLTTFGVAIFSGRLRSAVAFFAARGRSAVDRRKVVSAVYYCISGEKCDAEKVLEYVYENESPELKEAFIDAIAAIKYALYFFVLEKGEESDE